MKERARAGPQSERGAREALEVNGIGPATFTCPEEAKTEEEENEEDAEGDEEERIGERRER